MIKVNFVRTHIKQIFTHGLILGLFLVYCLFFAVPLFNILENTGVESGIIDISLPPETNNIVYGIERTMLKSSVIDFAGWAVTAGHVSADARIFIVIKGSNNTLVFKPFQYSRPDITRALGLPSGLEEVGFLALIPYNQIPQGISTLGIYIRSGDAVALQYTDSLICRAGNTLTLSKKLSTQQNTNLPPETGDINFGLDIIETSTVAEKTTRDITGWAFIRGKGAQGNTIYLVLKSADNSYIFDTIPTVRQDITLGYKEQNLNLDASGFKAQIINSAVKHGDYRLGILIINGSQQALIYSDKFIAF